MNSQTRRLRFYFLVPLIVVFAAAVVIVTLDTVLRQQRELATGVVRLQTTARQLYYGFVNDNTGGLELAMSLIQRDQDLRRTFESRDRDALLALAEPLYQDIHAKYRITHFYFVTPDRRVLLRVHQPERHGDIIDRTTTLIAEKLGSTVSGVELGPLGTLTLRLVQPWYGPDRQTLIGYVELGLELDALFEQIRTVFGVQMVLAIRKTYLARGAWESGMRMLGRTPDWDRYPDYVIAIEPPAGLPPQLAAELAQGSLGRADSWFDMLVFHPDLEIVAQSLNDVSGNPIAELVLLADISQQIGTARRLLTGVIIASAVSSLILFALFYWLVGQVGRRIDRDERKLDELATRDELTGLYNYRTFRSRLDDEIERASRSGSSGSLLMLDIDRFKSVNDTFGHLAGDRILVGLARLLRGAVRDADSVCRYGGEEFALILPTADDAAAAEIAERLRARVEKTGIDIDKGRTAFVTVSIGVAATRVRSQTANEVIQHADAALYEAKAAGRNRVRFHRETRRQPEPAADPAV